jgi:hypothetical protein
VFGEEKESVAIGMEVPLPGIEPPPHTATPLNQVKEPSLINSTVMSHGAIPHVDGHKALIELFGPIKTPLWVPH